MTGERRVALISDAAGYVVAVSDDARDLSRAEVTERLVTLALDRFGRLDAAVAFTGRIVVGRFLRSSVDDLRDALVGCVEAPYQFLRGVVPAWSSAVAARSWCSRAPPVRAQPLEHRSIRRHGPRPTC